MQIFRFFIIIKFRDIYFSTSLGHNWPLIDKVGCTLVLRVPFFFSEPSAAGGYNWLPAPLGWKLANAGNTKTVQNNRNWAELLLHDVYFIRSKDPQNHNNHSCKTTINWFRRTCNESKITLYTNSHCQTARNRLQRDPDANFGCRQAKRRHLFHPPSTLPHRQCFCHSVKESLRVLPCHPQTPLRGDPLPGLQIQKNGAPYYDWHLIQPCTEQVFDLWRPSAGHSCCLPHILRRHQSQVSLVLQRPDSI